MNKISLEENLRKFVEDDSSTTEKKEKQSLNLDDSEIFAVLLDHISIDSNTYDNLPFRLVQTKIKIYIVNSILEACDTTKFYFGKDDSSILLYNGAYWRNVSYDSVNEFLTNALFKAGYESYLYQDVNFIEIVRKQFLHQICSIKPKFDLKLLNLSNGTLEVDANGNFTFRDFSKDDYLTYQLSYEYNESVQCLKFHSFLDEVLPDKDAQKVLGEYLGYVFTTNLKLEKILFLYGQGANGKSVIYEIIKALFGKNNVTGYSLSDLCDTSKYFASEIENKLLNYTSELNIKNMNINIFKALASGEDISGREIYARPRMLSNIPKFIFNTNFLPKLHISDDAYLRRLLIIPFNITIPKEKQDPKLPARIIKDELPGILNWLLENLKTLISNEKFTESQTINETLNIYKKDIDSIGTFFRETSYKPGKYECLLSQIYNEYELFCENNGLLCIDKKIFSAYLADNNFSIKKLRKYNNNKVVYLNQSLVEVIENRMVA